MAPQVDHRHLTQHCEYSIVRTRLAPCQFWSTLNSKSRYARLAQSRSTCINKRGHRGVIRFNLILVAHRFLADLFWGLPKGGTPTTTHSSSRSCTGNNVAPALNQIEHSTMPLRNDGFFSRWYQERGISTCGTRPLRLASLLFPITDSAPIETPELGEIVTSNASRASKTPAQTPLRASSLLNAICIIRVRVLHIVSWSISHSPHANILTQSSHHSMIVAIQVPCICRRDDTQPLLGSLRILFRQ